MKKSFNILRVVVVFVIVILVSVCFIKLRRPENPSLIEQAKLLENKKIPIISILESQTNNDFSDEIYKGETVIVYMLSNCEACQKETQMISQIQPKTGIKILGIMFEDENVVKDYIKEHNVKFPVLIDKDKKLFTTLGLQYFPTNLKLKNGIVQAALFGSPTREDKLMEFIEK